MACCSCCTTVEQSEIGIIEDCGRFDRAVGPGMTCLWPCKEEIVGRVSMRLREASARIESKTKDNVFIKADVKVQYTALRNKVEQAFYELENPERQIEMYIHNSVRAQMPKYDVDQVFLLRAEISEAVKKEVDDAMDAFGYDIVSVLIVDFDLNPRVSDAMNSIQMYQREKVAVVDQAESAKIQVVKAAEAEAEAKRLSGVGLAEQRKAIVAGLQSSVEMFKQGVPGLGNDDIMSLLLLNQYFDTLKDVARHSSAVSLFLQHSGGLRGVAKQMQDGILHASK
jgi:regulator of protease activity HflC (stomatin/prohibitin superfamily)